MDGGVVGTTEIAAEEQTLDAPGKARVGGKDILKVPVGLAVFAHVYMSVLFHDPGLDLAGASVGERAELGLAADDGAADFFHAARTERVRLTRKSQRRRGALV